MFLETYVLLFSLHHLQLCRMLKTCWMNRVALRGLMESSSTSFYSKLCLVRYRLVKNHRDIFTGEPWLLHLLYSVSSQRQRCRPPSALRSWAREAAPQLVLETTRVPLPAVLVFLITVAQMQVGAFIPQQHCCFFIREGMTTPTSSLFYCEVNILSTVWKYLRPLWSLPSIALVCVCVCVSGSNTKKCTESSQKLKRKVFIGINAVMVR